jgi:GTPase SAR1 family protein
MANNGNVKAHDWVMKSQSVPSSSSTYYVIAHLLSLSLIVILIGDSATGKSSLMTRLIRNEWNPSITSTMGVHLWIKTVDVNSRVVKGSRDSFPLR